MIKGTAIDTGKISLTLLSSIAFLVMGASVAMSQTAKQISLEVILQQYKDKRSLNNISHSLNAQSEAQLQTSLRRFTEPFRVNLEADRGLANSAETEVTVKISRGIEFGIDESVLRNKYAALAQAELLDISNIRREEMKSIALLYAELRLHQQQAHYARQALDGLDPLVNKARLAANRGTISGLFVRRWQILQSRIIAEHTTAVRALETVGSLLRDISGADIQQDLRNILITDLPATFQASEFNVEESSVARIADLKQKAVAAQAMDLSNRWTLEAGVGHVRRLGDGRGSLLAEVSFPIGVASAARSEISALAAERELIAAQATLQSSVQKRKAVLLSGNRKKMEQSCQFAKRRVEELESLFRQVSAAISKAQAEPGELVETLGELYEARRASANAQKELEDSVIEHYFFVARDDL